MWIPRPDPGRARRYHAEGWWRDVSIGQAVAASCAARAHHVAVLDAQGGTLTYAELDAASSRLAGWLQNQGVGSGDIVTICLPNRAEAIVAFLGALKLGAVLNPVPVTYGPADMAYVIGKCASKAVIVAGRFRSADYTAYMARILPDLGHAPAVLVLGEGAHAVGTAWEEALARAPLADTAVPDADGPAAVLFTSGTESQPKGAVHSHNTILFGERAMARALDLTADDIAFMASPISHATGFLHGFAMTMMLGGTLSLLDVFTAPAAIAQMRAHKASWTMGATPFLTDTVRELAARSEALPDLRYFLCGGAPVPEEAVRRAADADIRVLSIYGSTESPPHTLVHPDDPAENAWTTDGRPLAGIEVRIAGADGGGVATGEVGEEWSRGPNTFLGYLDAPDLTAKALDADGWVHSGDLARGFPDGSIRIAGRIKELIIRGGQNISVREVEEKLLRIPGCRQVAVVGIPHERLGETGCAVFTVDPGTTITLADVQRFLIEAGTAKFKIPERVEVWERLPMTPSGKIQKYLIRKQLTDGIGAGGTRP
ncbi:AMP-binding protein [Futiania mangrovi]|uniref:AMP-binding protein n=1 Tax=Futiania mangrovi TaxID=2959716 RepID=A0A9J6P9D6_9PROT|nr:AMP-binding protein [Futiania mangrovii]MCP1335453.1 AMP-binding protein [Futiania mangrovii]